MIEIVAIKDLNFMKRNPRSISKEAFEKLCTSMREDADFIQCRPVLVNRCSEGLIVYAGNQRVRAAKKIGWKAIHCVIEDNLDEEVMKKRCVLDNMHYGEFDFDILTTDFDVDMLLDVGFTPESLTGDYGIEDVEADEKQADKKKKQCPNCGHQW